MAIYRGDAPAENFAMMPNHWFRDPRLSGKAKGYMGYIATHSPGYKLTIMQMVAEMAEGRDAVYAGLAELVEAGYLVRTQQRGAGEKFSEVDYHFGPAAYEQTYQRAWGTKDVSAGETASGFSVYGSSVYGSPDTKNTNSKKTKDHEVEWPSQAGRAIDDPNFVAPTESIPPENTPAGFTDWRADDLTLFRSVIGDGIVTDGSLWKPEGTFAADVWYDALRKTDKPIQWPGRYLSQLADSNGLDNWLLAKGLELVP